MPISRRTFGLAAVLSLSMPCLSRAQGAAPLEIGVLPNISARVLLAQYQPLRDFLSRELQRPVQVSTAPSWSAFHQRILGGEYHVIVNAAHLARVAQVDRGYVPLLAYSPNIKGMLVFAASRPIAGLPDLRGQTLVLSNPQSLVTLRGMQWLAENGLHRDRDFKTITTPTDDSVGAVVVRGDAIAAMLSGGEYRAIPETLRSQLQILKTFAEVPGFVVMASPKLSAGEARSIKEHFLRFANGSDEGKAFFASSGFTAIKELEPGLMESMDQYAEATRRLLTAGS